MIKRAEDTLLRCPSCHAPVSWEQLDALPSACACGFVIRDANGVPALVRDSERIRQIIAEATAEGRGAWYEEPQAAQFTGPYRHHLKKRHDYLGLVFEQYGFNGSKPTRGLDLGCGDGNHANLLASRVGSLYGSDYNPRRLDRALQTGVYDVVYMADVTEYPAEDDAFDLVFFNHVLEHIPDDVAALREVARVLNPGGLAIVGTPNEGAAWWRLAYRLQPSSRRTTDHVHFYTAHTLRERCQRAGLRVIDVDHLGWGVPHWWLDARLRTYRRVDDAFERVGRRVAPRQASSLYALLKKA